MAPTKDTLSRESDSNSNETKQELSLKNDSEEVARLRKNVPAEKKAENDDLRDILSLLGEVKKAPNEHREKFESRMRAIREKQRIAHQRQRDAFNKEERRSREHFLEELKVERDRFFRSKHDADEKRDFTTKQNDARQEYFADEKDKRRDFESDVRQKMNDQTAFYKEKSDEFYKELKIYTTKYNEMQKVKKSVPATPASGSRSGAADDSEPKYLLQQDPNNKPVDLNQ